MALPPPPADAPAAHALALLGERGAGRLPHPGGDLATHLRRVHSQLATWGARPAHGPDLLALFTRVSSLLSPAAWADCQAVLAGPLPGSPEGPPPPCGVPSAG